VGGRDQERGRLSDGLHVCPVRGRGSGLQLVQVFDGALGVGGGRNDGALVVLQDLDPLGDTGGVVLARLKVEAKVRGEEGRPEFRDQFLPAVPFIAPPLLRPKLRSSRDGWRVQWTVSCPRVA